MSISEIHHWIGSDEHVGVRTCVQEVRSHCSVSEHRSGSLRTTLYQTPYGDTRLVRRFDPPSQSWHPIKFPITDLATLKVMTAFYEDTTAALDLQRLAEAREHVRLVGEDGFTFISIGESPLMFFVEWLAGVENAHLLLADYRTDVEALFEAVHQLLLAKTALLAEHSPTDVLYFTENTSTTLISPRQHRRYCVPHLTAYGEVTAAHGRVLNLHMCGKLKLLLPELAKLPVQGFEAFTAPPLGSTTLLDGRVGCPDKALIGGTHAMLWTRSADEIIAYIAQSLAELPNERGVVVTSAGVMPPLCEPETLRAVCDWVREHSVRV
jgi:uroporphyrinogen-III decarboxylase